MTRTIFSGSVLALGLLLCAPQARAQQDSRAISAVRQYAAEHGFNVRVVESGPPNRRVRRAFVAVTPQTWSSFFKKYNKSTGYVALRHTADGTNHVVPNLEVDENGTPKDCYLYGLNYNASARLPNGFMTSDCRTSYMNPSHAGNICVVDIGEGPLQHLAGFLQNNMATGNRLYPGNCMEWLSNAEVAPGKTLFHVMGVKRSRDGGQIISKLRHATNDTVTVFGVVVPSAAQFDAMTDQQLLGPEPHAGIPAAVIE